MPPSRYTRLGERERPSIWSNLLLQFLNPLLALGKQRPLQTTDLPPLDDSHNAQRWHEAMSQQWLRETQQTRRRPSLWRVLLRLGARRLFITGVLNSCEVLLPLIQVVCLQQLVGYLSNEGSAADRPLAAVGFLVFMCASSAISAMLRHYAFAQQRALGMDLQTGVAGMLYAKALRLSLNTSKGTVMTLAATDSVRIRNLTQHIHLIWITPCCLVVALGMCWYILGVATLAALGVAILMVPLNWKTTQKFEEVEAAIMAKQQSRMKRFSEILQGMLVVKLFSWEHAAARRVAHFRNQELKAVLGLANALSAVMTIIWSAATIMAVAAFSTHYALGKPLLPTVVFPALFLFDFMTFPMLELPYTIGDIAGTLASISRLEAFFLRPEVVSVRPGAPPASRLHGFVGAPPATGAAMTSASTAGAVAPAAGMDKADGGAIVWLRNATLYWATVEKQDPEEEDADCQCCAATATAARRLLTCGGCRCRPSASASASASNAGTAVPLPPAPPSPTSPGAATARLLPSPGTPAPISVPPSSGDVKLTVGDGSHGATNAAAPALSAVSLSVRPGELLAIVGPVGAGKSSLMASLLGELMPTPPKALPTAATLAAVDMDDRTVSLPVGVASDVVYAPQQPWIRSATIQDNILCGQPLDMDVYNRVLDACALRPDLALFPAGDGTEVGERGVTLSGGQKQRLSLARAAYRVLTTPSSTPVACLLDDPLSAVDAHVGETLFNETVCGVLAGQARILVTHQLQFLPKVDRVVVLDAGGVLHNGTYDQLVADGVQFASLNVESTPMSPPAGDDGGASGLIDGGDAGLPARPAAVPPPIMHAGMGDALAGVEKLALIRNTSDEVDESGRLAAFVDVDVGVDMEAEVKGGGPLVEVQHHTGGGGAAAGAGAGAGGAGATASTAAAGDGKVIEEEERYTGTVGWPVYKAYFTSLGAGWFVVALVVVSLSLEAVKTGTTLWLTWWSSVEEDAARHGTHADTVSYLAGYVVLGLGTAALSLARNLMWFRGAYRAAKRLHDRMLGAVLRAPMAWFNATPQGRIINRFSKDQNVVDHHLPDYLSDVLLAALELVARIATILAATPLFVLALPVMVVVYRSVAQTYRCSSRELRRLGSITSSPVHSQFSETVDGLATLRAFRMQRREMATLFARTNLNNSTFYYTVMSDAWIGQRVEMLSAAIVGTVGALAIAAQWTGASWLMGSATMLPLSMTYAISLTGSTSWTIRVGTKAEAEMSRVERMMHYAALQPEAPLTSVPPAVDDHITASTSPSAYAALSAPAPSWPTTGRVEFRDVVMTYKPGVEPVLKGVSFTAHHGHNVGVVGRTGAGKSSLLMALFRIVEPLSGAVLVDGVDTATVGLRDLRTALSIIPQDPVLFSGTIRSNLDADVADADPDDDSDGDHASGAAMALGTISDARLWDALQRCGLEAYVRSLPGGLDAAVDEGGQSLSVGQRQLLSLARALLRSSRVLVLDEATASVDVETDNRIQRTIRTTFADTTIVTIAHRLPTIIDYDRVLVMDAGRVAEYDHPHVLLSDADSVFSGMVDSTGAASAAFLRRAAAKSFERQRRRGGGGV